MLDLLLGCCEGMALAQAQGVWLCLKGMKASLPASSSVSFLHHTQVRVLLERPGSLATAQSLCSRVRALTGHTDVRTSLLGTALQR